MSEAREFILGRGEALVIELPSGPVRVIVQSVASTQGSQRRVALGFECRRDVPIWRSELLPKLNSNEGGGG